MPQRRWLDPRVPHATEGPATKERPFVAGHSGPAT